MTIVFAGDSITAAQYVTQAETFAQKIGTALGFGNIVNSGISGQKASQVLAGINAQILSHNPDACIIMIGTNDIATAWEDTTENATLISGYISSMGSIIDQVKAAGIRLTVFSPPLTKRPEEAQRFPAFVAALADLCHAKGAAFVDIAGRMASDARNTNAFFGWFRAEPLDNYHLSATGHQRITDFFLGTQLVTPAIAPPDPLTVGTALAATLGSSFGNGTGKTFRCRIPIGSLTIPSGAVTRMRVCLHAHADEPVRISKMFVGPRTTGHAVSDFNPVKVGGHTAFTIPAGAEIWSDWLSFIWDKTADLIWSFYVDGGATMDRLAADTAHDTASTGMKTGDEASILAPADFINYPGYLSLVSGIQTDGF